jgi:hypothetical protein
MPSSFHEKRTDMRAVSFHTGIPDPYRAGIALGESLAALSPEVVFVFSSVHYSVPELLDGLHEALDNEDTIVVGNSGDGFYEATGASDLGAAVLGLNSGGQVRWRLEHVKGLKNNLEDKLQQLVARLSAGGETPRLGYLVSDFRADESAIESVLRNRVGFPVVGGFAADDQRMLASYLYVDGKVVSDALVVLAAYGDLRFSIAIGNSLQPIGHAGLIDAAAGTQIDRIDGTSAMDFIARQTGKPVLQTDRGILSLMVHDPEFADEKRLRAIVPNFATKPGSVGLFGSVAAGVTVQVCLARPEDLVAEVYAIAEAARAGGRPPAAALVISCSGRKALLGGHIEHEISALTQAFPQGLPLAGFPSFGEIGPLRRGSGYTRNLFHHMTYVVLLIEQ